MQAPQAAPDPEYAFPDAHAHGFVTARKPSKWYVASCRPCRFEVP